MRALRAAIVTFALLSAGAAPAAEPAEPVVVFAAASLTDAVGEVSKEFTRETGIPVKPSFAASSVLAKQLESGAPVGVFFSADQEWTDYLEQRHLLAPGKYATAALTKLGAWDRLAPQLVRAENVRSALAFVARGEAPFGIVYLTDARIEKRVKLAGTFPVNTHPPIRYPIAVTAKGDAGARQFVTFASGKKAAVICEKYGFSLVH